MTWVVVAVIVADLVLDVAIFYAVKRWLDNRKKNWANYRLGNEVHCVPRNDLIGHEWENCACSPKTIPVLREDGSVGWQVIHDALDGRE